MATAKQATAAAAQPGAQPNNVAGIEMCLAKFFRLFSVIRGDDDRYYGGPMAEEQ
ncbi:hypothetical protein U1Q18_017672, partial [Sarracenia purpurea var. burkii]